MLIIPAIDLMDGKCVRLRQGRADDKVIYSDDPVGFAMKWEAEGGGCLHIVDLDGAFSGKPVHTEVVAKIVKAVKIPVEVGGGIRTDADAEKLLSLGVARVILGTRAFQDPDSIAGMTARHGRKIAVGIDARNGMVQVKGWVESTGMKAVDLAVKADGMGVGAIIYTDISRDGMLDGTNTIALSEICAAVKCNVIASGGISSAADIRKIDSLKHGNIYGAIVGKALYDGKVTMRELVNAIIQGRQF